MTKQELSQNIIATGSYLCVGLDTDLTKIPKHLLSEPDPVFEFNRQIIDATKDHCVAYKINTAFYEANGVKGWESMEKTLRYIPESKFRIADAKRGDIGNTSAQYARAFFETMPFDAITVAPYMGKDSIKPFLDVPGKWTILLALTSNPGAADFEMQWLTSEEDILDEGVHYHKKTRTTLYNHVIQTAKTWGSDENLMFVAGATRAEELAAIRELVPDHFLLVPGVGAQGGSLEEVSKSALTSQGGLLVNASRAIIYASGEKDFATVAAGVAKDYHQQMKALLQAK